MRSSLLARVHALESFACNAGDPFAHLDDGELQTLVRILRLHDAGEPQASQRLWLECSAEQHAKFERAIGMCDGEMEAGHVA